jgi:hypothetical protein
LLLVAITFFFPTKDDERLVVSVLSPTALSRLLAAIVFLFTNKDDEWFVALIPPAWTGIAVKAVPTIIVAKQILLAEKQNLTNR